MNPNNSTNNSNGQGQRGTDGLRPRFPGNGQIQNVWFNAGQQKQGSYPHRFPNPVLSGSSINNSVQQPSFASRTQKDQLMQGGLGWKQPRDYQLPPPHTSPSSSNNQPYGSRPVQNNAPISTDKTRHLEKSATNNVPQAEEPILSDARVFDYGHDSTTPKVIHVPGVKDFNPNDPRLQKRYQPKSDTLSAAGLQKMKDQPVSNLQDRQQPMISFDPRNLAQQNNNHNFVRHRSRSQLQHESQGRTPHHSQQEERHTSRSRHDSQGRRSCHSRPEERPRSRRDSRGRNQSPPNERSSASFSVPKPKSKLPPPTELFDHASYQASLNSCTPRSNPTKITPSRQVQQNTSTGNQGIKRKQLETSSTTTSESPAKRSNVLTKSDKEIQMRQTRDFGTGDCPIVLETKDIAVDCDIILPPTTISAQVETITVANEVQAISIHTQTVQTIDPTTATEDSGVQTDNLDSQESRKQAVVSTETATEPIEFQDQSTEISSDFSGTEAKLLQVISLRNYDELRQDSDSWKKNDLLQLNGATATAAVAISENIISNIWARTSEAVNGAAGDIVQLFPNGLLLWVKDTLNLSPDEMMKTNLNKMEALKLIVKDLSDSLYQQCAKFDGIVNASKIVQLSQKTLFSYFQLVLEINDVLELLPLNKLEHSLNLVRFRIERILNSLGFKDVTLINLTNESAHSFVGNQERWIQMLTRSYDRIKIAEFNKSSSANDHETIGCEGFRKQYKAILQKYDARFAHEEYQPSWRSRHDEEEDSPLVITSVYSLAAEQGAPSTSSDQSSESPDNIDGTIIEHPPPLVKRNDIPPLSTDEMKYVKNKAREMVAAKNSALPNSQLQATTSKEKGQSTPLSTQRATRSKGKSQPSSSQPRASSSKTKGKSAPLNSEIKSADSKGNKNFIPSNSQRTDDSQNNSNPPNRNAGLCFDLIRQRKRN